MKTFKNKYIITILFLYLYTMKKLVTFMAEEDVLKILDDEKKRGMKVGFVINEAIREHKKKKSK